MNIKLELNVPYTGKEFFIGIIGEEPAKNKSQKDRQKRIASEKCSYYTTGTGRGMKYIITEIYSQQRIRLNGKYAEHMRTVLIYLLQNNNRRIIAPKSVLMSECGFVNNKYLDAKRYNKKTAEENEVMLSSTVMFLKNVDDLLGQSLKRNMQYLVNASYVISKTKKRCKFTIKETNIDKKGNVIYVNGKPDIQVRNAYMLMNEEQEEYISGAIRLALNEGNYSTLNDVYKLGRKEKDIFYNKVYSKIRPRITNDFTDYIIKSEENWIHNNKRLVEIYFEYFYEVYDIRANEYIYDFKISKDDFKQAIYKINQISKQSIRESMYNPKTLLSRNKDIEELNMRYKEENNCEKLAIDVEILIGTLISINLK